MSVDAPLSSLEIIPLTADTRQKLVDLGVDPKRIRGLTEMGGQSLLTLHQQVHDDDGAHVPDCYRSEFDPCAALCKGCVYQPRCWRGDEGYLRRLVDGQTSRPVGVPDRVIDRRIEEFEEQATANPARKAPPPPPKRKKKTPPPPPPRKS